MSASGHLRTPFFEAAMEILAADGYGGLKLAPLCKRLGVTTGAFYHSFKNWGDFTTRLLDGWLDERTQAFVDLAHTKDDPLDQLDVLLDAAVALPHESEAAIRVWSSIDPTVGKIQDRVDRARYDIVLEAFGAMLAPKDAERFAKAGLYILVGAEQAHGYRDRDTLEWALHELKSMAAHEAQQNCG